MTLISSETIQRVKLACPLDRVVERYCTLDRGRCLCPFHDDHRPSLQINQQRGHYRCFVCGAAGDVISFVQAIERVTFEEAVTGLARHAGIPVDQTVDCEKESLLKSCSEAESRYRALLVGPPLDYLIHRGLTRETIDRFGLGFCQRGCLQGIDSTDEAGLTVDSHERLPNRIIFPIRDILGRTIAFAGRCGPTAEQRARESGEHVAKYLNTPTTRLFSKEQTLYALDLARCSKAKEVYLVEGYMDVISLYQRGITAVATMGTALTIKHVPVLRRLDRRLILAFDGDDPGQRAAEKASRLLIQSGVDHQILTLSDIVTQEVDSNGNVIRVLTKRDPDDSLDGTVEQPIPFLARRLLGQHGREPHAIQSICRDFSQLMQGVDEILAHQMTRQFADIVGVPYRMIKRTTTTEPPQEIPVSSLDHEMARLCCNATELCMFEYQTHDARYRAIIDRVLGFACGGEVPSFDQIVDGLTGDDRDLAFQILEDRDPAYWQDLAHDIQDIMTGESQIARLTELKRRKATGEDCMQAIASLLHEMTQPG